MDAAWRELIGRIHASPRKCVLAVTGGGASAIAQLLSVPGGSRTVLEAIVPYSPESLAQWLGRAPEHFCSEETALAMAAVAYQRAKSLCAESGETASDVLGVSCTAALVSDRPKKGDHRCFVAVQSTDQTWSDLLVLEKGARDRDAEESLVGQLILAALARAAGITDAPPLALRPSETVVTQAAIADSLLIELANGSRNLVWSVNASSSPHLPISVSPNPPPRGFLCGAFNPVHDGHRELRAAAERHLGGPVCYELSIHNVDKPPLDYLTIERRRAQFTEHELALTNAPTFAAKSRVLPQTVFVVGVDTAERIVDPKYYPATAGGSDGLHAALELIRAQGCRFLVAGRLEGDRFVELKDIAIPPAFADLFESLPAVDFRCDISSTELRKCRAEDKDVLSHQSGGTP